MPLPNKTHSACLRYLPYIQAALLSPTQYVEVEVPTKEIAETTFVARTRDALSGLIDYNWASWDIETLAKVDDFAVIPNTDKPGFVFIGNKQELLKLRKAKTNIFATTTSSAQPGTVDTSHAIKITPTWDNIKSVCGLITRVAFDPQPIFAFEVVETGLDCPFPAEWKYRIATEYPNVVLIQEPTPNEHKYKLL